MRPFSSLLTVPILGLLLTWGGSLLGWQLATAQSCNAFTVLGSASAQNGCYTLTRQSGPAFSLGAMWSTNTISLATSFDYSFSIEQCGTADGLAFVLQNSGIRLGTDARNDAGQNLGYYNSSNDLFRQSLGIELDLFRNPNYGDPAVTHMMLAINGSPTPAGSSATGDLTGPVAAAGLGDCARPIHLLRINWDHTTRVLRAYLDGTLRLQYTRDLVSNLFGGNPNVRFGFTGATGNETATQTICPVGEAAPSTISGPRAVCAGAPTTLTATSPDAGATFAWAPPTGLNTTIGPTVVAAPAATTVYTLTTTTAAGCSRQDTVGVTVTPEPQLTVEARVASLTERTVSFTAATGATAPSAYSWDFGDGSAPDPRPAPTHAYAAPGTYTVRLTIGYGAGCTLEKTLIVAVSEFRLPNIITPNGDQVNDTFQPRVSFEPVTLQVFNRWGRLVFERANYAGDWYAADLPSGTYYYHLNTAGGEHWKGWLEVVR